MEGTRKRKPFSDCTNTNISSPPSFKNPLLAPAFKKLLNDTKGKSVINANSKPGSTAADENSSGAASEDPSSVSVASTPSKSNRVSGTGARYEVVEPSSVYVRRSTAAKTKRRWSLGTGGRHEVLELNSVSGPRTTAARKKSKRKEVAVPVTGSVPARFKTAEAGDENKKDRDIVQQKSHKSHHEKKRKHDEDAPLHTLPKEFIEEQKAYYKAVDEFELEEEEVESVDQLE